LCAQEQFTYTAASIKWSRLVAGHTPPTCPPSLAPTPELFPSLRTRLPRSVFVDHDPS